MTVIFGHGGNFWIEQIQGDVTTIAVDTNTLGSSIPLERGGTIVGWAAITRGNMGRSPIVQLSEGDGTVLNFGDVINSVAFRVMTRIDFGGVLVEAIVFMRKTGPPS